MSNVNQNTNNSATLQTEMKVADLFQRAKLLLPEIGSGSADRERLRQLPDKQIKSLADAKLLTFRIPKKYKGSGSTVREVIRFIIEVASFDSNIAQALRPSFLFIEALLSNASENERKLWFNRYLQGQIVGNAGWEIGGANGEISTRIVHEGQNFRVTGSKYYSTGGLYADWILIVALNERDKPVSFILPRQREGLEILDDFDAMGQRLTASGTTNLKQVLVYPEEIQSCRFKDNMRSVVTPFAQIFLAAVEVGISLNVLKDAIQFTQKKARPIKHSTAQRSVDDPYVEYVIGEISARALAAEATVLHAADSLDDAWAAQLAGDKVNHAAVTVAQAQFIAIEAALKSAELLFDVGGGSTTTRADNFDRHWRNARTVANHNPRAWKAAAVGAYYLKGTELPLSGLF
jgi:alkylation response protein AidB-like acyl-CoA dehydrogenase